MNAACIAACAVHPIPRVEEPLQYYVTADSPDWYVSLSVRLYLHFEPASYVKPAFCNGIYMHEVVEVEPRTIAIAKSYLLKASEMKNVNADNYIDIILWQKEKYRIIKQYCDEIQRRYDVKVDPDDLQYTHQFCWSFDSKEEE